MLNLYLVYSLDNFKGFWAAYMKDNPILVCLFQSIVITIFEMHPLRSKIKTIDDSSYKSYQSIDVNLKMHLKKDRCFSPFFHWAYLEIILGLHSFPFFTILIMLGGELLEN